VDQIAVIGSNTIANEKTKQIAYELGAEIAKNNLVLVCGGKDGVMKYAAKGAKENKGITVGILPEDSFSFANEFIDIKIPTGMGYGRNILVIKSADVIIALEGSKGTLSEMAHASNENKFLIVLRGTGGICDYVSNHEFKFLDVKVVETPKEAVREALNFIQSKN